MVSHQPQLFRILAERHASGQPDLRVGQDISRQSSSPFEALELQILLQPDDEERFKPVDPFKFGEGIVASVENVVCPGLEGDFRHRLRVVHGGGGDMVEGRYAGLQIVERMHFHSPVVPAEPRPGEKRQAERDRGRVEGVGIAVQHEDLLRASPSCLPHHEEREILEDTVVAPLVRVGKGGLCDRAAPKAQMVAFRPMRLKRDDQIPKAFTPAELPEHQCEKLVPAGKMADVEIAIVLLHEAPELVVVEKLHQLSERVFVLVHMQSPC